MSRCHHQTWPPPGPVDLLVDLHLDMDQDITMELVDLDLDILAILQVDLLAAMVVVDMVDLQDLVDQDRILPDLDTHHLALQAVMQLLAVILLQGVLHQDILHHLSQDNHLLDLLEDIIMLQVDLKVALVDPTVVQVDLIVDMAVLTVDLRMVQEVHMGVQSDPPMALVDLTVDLEDLHMVQ